MLIVMVDGSIFLAAAATATTAAEGSFMSSVRAAIERVAPLEVIGALIAGCVIGYFVGRFFGADLMESKTFKYLSGKKRLRN